MRCEKSTGEQRQSWEVGGEKAKGNCDRREKPLERSEAGGRLLCSARILLLCKNEARALPASPSPDGPEEGLIRPVSKREKVGQAEKWPWEQILKRQG